MSALVGGCRAQAIAKLTPTWFYIHVCEFYRLTEMVTWMLTNKDATNEHTVKEGMPVFPL